MKANCKVPEQGYTFCEMNNYALYSSRVFPLVKISTLGCNDVVLCNSSCITTYL